jgi:hypothetical protein
MTTIGTTKLLLAGTSLLAFFGSAAVGYGQARGASFSTNDENCGDPVEFCDECDDRGVAHCAEIISEWKCKQVDNVEVCGCEERFGLLGRRRIFVAPEIAPANVMATPEGVTRHRTVAPNPETHRLPSGPTAMPVN